MVRTLYQYVASRASVLQMHPFCVLTYCSLSLCGCLYIRNRSLLHSTRQLQDDLETGRTLFNAIRSGATDSYTGVKSDWVRERKFDNRFADMQAIQQWNRKRAFVTVVRSQFELPVDEQDTAAVNRRIDAGKQVAALPYSPLLQRTGAGRSVAEQERVYSLLRSVRRAS